MRPPSRNSPPAPARRYGARPLGAILPPITRIAFRKLSPDGAQLMADWPAVIGPALAAVTIPRRLAQGTLTLGCAGPVAMELQHLAPQLIARINGHLGRAAVVRLRLVQDAPRPPPAAPSAAPPPPRPAALLEAVAAVPDPELRAALEKLTAGVYRGRR